MRNGLSITMTILAIFMYVGNVKCLLTGRKRPNSISESNTPVKRLMAQEMNTAKYYNLKAELLISPEIKSLYEFIDISITDFLKAIAAAVTVQVNSHPKIVNNNVRVNIDLVEYTGPDLIKYVSQGICLDSMERINKAVADSILDHNGVDKRILFFPCPSYKFREVLQYYNNTGYVVSNSGNTTCKKAVGIFFEPDIDSLFTAFGTALIHLMNADINKFIYTTPVSKQDAGVEYNISISDAIIDSMINSQCFQKDLSIQPYVDRQRG